MHPELHELVIAYLEEIGFNASLWAHYESCRMDGVSDNWTHRYIILPGLFKLIVIEKKHHGGLFKLEGIPGFEIAMLAEDPNSLEVMGKTLCDLYIWMKNINSDCVKELLNESQGFRGGVNL